MAHAIMIISYTGQANTLCRAISNHREIRQPFDGAVIERPYDFEQWSCETRIEADAMADMVRKSCPMATISVVAA